MEPVELTERLNFALSDFSIIDVDLLRQDAHEEAISSALIKHLTKHFGDLMLDIDGQYDKRHLNNQLIKKQTMFLISRLPVSKRGTGTIIDEESILKQVLPDLILHKRIDSLHNFLVLEIKKSTNSRPDDRAFDLLKLSVFTEGDLNYRFGAFINFTTGDEYNSEQPYTLFVYQNGKSI